jgi:hypothetical protein
VPTFIAICSTSDNCARESFIWLIGISFVIYRKVYLLLLRLCHIYPWASVAEWQRSLTSNHLPLTVVGSNPERDFGFFQMR